MTQLSIHPKNLFTNSDIFIILYVVSIDLDTADFILEKSMFFSFPENETRPTYLGIASYTLLLFCVFIAPTKANVHQLSFKIVDGSGIQVSYSPEGKDAIFALIGANNKSFADIEVNSQCQGWARHYSASGGLVFTAYPKDTVCKITLYAKNISDIKKVIFTIGKITPSNDGYMRIDPSYQVVGTVEKIFNLFPPPTPDAVPNGMEGIDYLMTVQDVVEDFVPFTGFNAEENIAYNIKKAVELPVPSAREVCAEDYANWQTNPYGCMRIFIKGVTELHNALNVLRAYSVIPELTTPNVVIIDDFENADSHGNRVVIPAFNSMAGNTHTTCQDGTRFNSAIKKCYADVHINQTANLSIALVHFDEELLAIVPPDTAPRSVHISLIALNAVGARIGLGTGNEGAKTGPNQINLQSVIHTGQITLVGGWSSEPFINYLLHPNFISNLAYADEINNFIAAGFRAIKSNSCAAEGDSNGFAKRCVLFPFRQYYFDNNGQRYDVDGTSGATAMYTGVIDLLQTIWQINSSEADAIVRSCAEDLNETHLEARITQTGEGFRSFFLESQVYGIEGIDFSTGRGRADLSCLLDSNSITGLVQDAKSVIDCSLADDYPDPTDRSRSRLRLEHCS